jgi:hypothetical protein
MAKAMKRRDVERALRRQGCEVIAEGPHTKWLCPSGEHTANIPHHKEISPGVIRDTIARMTCLPEGWLQ